MKILYNLIRASVVITLIIIFTTPGLFSDQGKIKGTVIASASCANYTYYEIMTTDGKKYCWGDCLSKPFQALLGVGRVVSVKIKNNEKTILTKNKNCHMNLRMSKGKSVVAYEITKVSNSSYLIMAKLSDVY